MGDEHSPSLVNWHEAVFFEDFLKFAISKMGQADKKSRDFGVSFEFLKFFFQRAGVGVIDNFTFLSSKNIHNSINEGTNTHHSNPWEV